MIESAFGFIIYLLEITVTFVIHLSVMRSYFGTTIKVSKVSIIHLIS